MNQCRTEVLFLCTGNYSARSQMAEAYLRHYAGDQFEAHSDRPKINFPVYRSKGHLKRIHQFRNLFMDAPIALVSNPRE